MLFDVMCCINGLRNLGAVKIGDRRNHITARGIGDVKGFAAFGIDPFAAYKGLRADAGQGV